MRKGYRKRTTTRRNFSSSRPLVRHRKKKGVDLMAKVLRPKIYSFKRDFETVLHLDNNTPPEGWSSTSAAEGSIIYKNLGWSLSTLGNHTEFQTLFKQYRIIGARLRFYATTTESGINGATGNYTNSQVILRAAPNFSGVDTVLNTAFWQQVQAKKYYTLVNGGKPLDMYMPLYQENEITSSTGTANTFTKPKFVPTAADNVVHYGQSIGLQRADGQQFTSGAGNKQSVRIIATVYFQTRAVV